MSLSEAERLETIRAASALVRDYLNVGEAGARSSMRDVFQNALLVLNSQFNRHLDDNKKATM